MIDILTWLITLPTNPIGFVFLISLIIFFEYKVARSIMKDKNAIHVKKILNYIKKLNWKRPLSSLDNVMGLLKSVKSMIMEAY